MSKAELLRKTRDELLAIAQRLGLRGISTLRKPELVERVLDEQQQKKRTGARVKEPMGVTAVAKRVAAAVKRRAVRKRITPVPKSAATARKAPAKRSSGTSKPSLVEAAVTNGSHEIAAHKYDVTPAPPPPKQTFIEEHLGELPESYGTGRVFLTARDPHWLFAYWDLGWQQLADARGQSSDGRVLLRVFEKNHAQPVHEFAIQNDSRNWYIPVNKAATTYSAELGYWRRDGHFHVINRSREVATPPDVISPDTTARFVTIPIDISFRELLSMIRGHMKDGEALAEALHRLQAAGFRFPFQVGVELGPWGADQAAALERILGGDLFRRIQIGSAEISEWLRRRLSEELSSGMFSSFSPAGASWSAAPQQKGFWFAVNAELIIYGATEPDAKVTVDGKPVALRSDGTFSFHYAFPDGEYRLPVVAISKDGDDKRGVDLTFKRHSAVSGDVGKVKQPRHLKSPAAA